MLQRRGDGVPGLQAGQPGPVAGDQVNVFLLGKGVECEDIDDERFVVTKEIMAFLDAGGRTYSCSSCMRLRAKGETQACALSKMSDLNNIIAESDKVITFQVCGTFPRAHLLRRVKSRMANASHRRKAMSRKSQLPGYA